MERKNDVFIKADKIAGKIVKYFSFVAVAAVIVMGFIATINVISTKVFGTTIQITNEVVKYFMVPACLCLLPEIQMGGGLMQVDLFSRKYGVKGKKIISVVGCVMGIIAFSLAAWRNAVLLEKNIRLQEMSAMSKYALPLWPFSLICLISLILLVLSFIWSIIKVIVLPEVEMSVEGPNLDEKEKSGKNIFKKHDKKEVGK